MIHGKRENKFHTSLEILATNIQNIDYHEYLFTSLNSHVLHVSLNYYQNYFKVTSFDDLDCWLSHAGTDIS